ncbi:hypothetical protein [Lunatibacter salilacus]|uniref:hypothetical protein n=1 Tax=Lunatibacter salilacus TaxID=2483804 RepID=UPI001F354042|nr:hypothetical protein [Lunatibacter salilacus]
MKYPKITTRLCFTAFALILFSQPATSQTENIPEAVINNGVVQATLYLPDSETGYYRGTRFDWSGVIGSLEYNGHSYFGQWFPTYDPFLHDAITGPVEAFDPIGYENAQPGETFLKIGVGTLKKINDEPYRFTAPFEIVDDGKWSVKKKKDRVVFSHVLKDADGYAYRYEKTLKLTKGKPEMVLSHSLKNTGHKQIETQVYNHNFFMIDDQPIGPDYSVTFPFDLELISNTRGMGTTVEIHKNKLVFLEPIQPRESIYVVLGGYSDQASDYDITVANSKTGAGVRITNDRPITHFPVWSIPTTLCPEPYMLVSVAPGQTFTWNTTYEFLSEKP